MPIKLKVLLSAITLVTAFAVGRWMAPEKIREVTKTVEVESKSKNTDKDTHKKTTTTETVAPDGTKTTKTETEEDASTKRQTTDNSNITVDTEKEITRSSSKVSVLGLAGVSFTREPPRYGVSVSRPLIGPITSGLWYLTPGIFGVSLGLTF